MSLEKLTLEEKRAKKRARWRAWYEKNTERVRASQQAWRERNPEKARAMFQAWTDKNPGRCVENNRSWRRRNPDKCKQIWANALKVVKGTNDKIRKTATQHCQPWEPVDDAWLMEFTGTDKEAAIQMGRSLYAIKTRKKLLRKQDSQLP